MSSRTAVFPGISGRLSTERSTARSRALLSQEMRTFFHAWAEPEGEDLRPADLLRVTEPFNDPGLRCILREDGGPHVLRLQFSLFVEILPEDIPGNPVPVQPLLIVPPVVFEAVSRQGRELAQQGKERHVREQRPPEAGAHFVHRSGDGVPWEPAFADQAGRVVGVPPGIGLLEAFEGGNSGKQHGIIGAFGAAFAGCMAEQGLHGLCFRPGVIDAQQVPQGVSPSVAAVREDLVLVQPLQACGGELLDHSAPLPPAEGSKGQGEFREVGYGDHHAVEDAGKAPGRSKGKDCEAYQGLEAHEAFGACVDKGAGHELRVFVGGKIVKLEGTPGEHVPRSVEHVGERVDEKHPEIFLPPVTLVGGIPLPVERAVRPYFPQYFHGVPHTDHLPPGI